MHDFPTFIETSKGLINLALVKTIETHAETIRFWFGGEDAVSVPLQEAERILSQIRMNIVIS